MSEDKKIQKDQPKDELSPGRRAALKKILVGTGVVGGSLILPEKWTKPVVDSIILPAHADASGTSTDGPTTSPPTTTNTTSTPPPQVGP